MLWIALALALDPAAPAMGTPAPSAAASPDAASPADAPTDATLPAGTELDAASPDAGSPEPAPEAGQHTLTVSVIAPPAGSIIEATAFGRTQPLRDPGVGVHSAVFAGPPSRFVHLQLTATQAGTHIPIYDGMVPMSDADADEVSFVVADNGRWSAQRTATSPSAAVRLWTAPGSVARYGWALLLAAYAGLALHATTRKA